MLIIVLVCGLIHSPLFLSLSLSLYLSLSLFPSLQVQEIKADPGTPLSESIAAINACFPEEIVKYYSPGYSETLLQRVESFQPTVTTQS